VRIPPAAAAEVKEVDVVSAAAGAAGAAAAGVEAAEARAVATSLLKEELGAIEARERPRLRRGVRTRRAHEWVPSWPLP
jgi:hypothetical protein